MSSGRSVAMGRDAGMDPVARLLRAVAPKPTRRLGPQQRVELRSLVMRRWQADAACASADPAAWYPNKGSIPVRQVSRICAACPVNRSCLVVALLWDEDGIWAGTNPGHRREGYRLMRQGVSAASAVELLLTQPKQLRSARRRWNGAANPTTEAESHGLPRGDESGDREAA